MKSKNNKYEITAKLKIILFLVLFVLGVFFSIKTMGISLVLCIFVFYIPNERKKITIINFGKKGEKVTSDILKKLPTKYEVLYDKTIKKPNGSNQLDHIVVGPNGIFIVETKYHIGKIKGDDSDVKVLQQKKTSSGKKYSSRFLNPTKQVQTHERTVRRRLDFLGFENISVVGIVFFSNYKANVKLKSKINKVFSVKKNGRRKLLKYIKRYRGDSRLSKNDILKITSSI